MRLILLGLCLAALAPATRADTPPPGPKLSTRDAALRAKLPPAQTEAELAAARAEGNALLKAAHAEDLFANETSEPRGPGISLRHKASGFLCFLVPGKSANLVSVHRSLVRGDDVGCRTDGSAGRTEVFFTRAPERKAEDQLAEEIKVVKLNDPGSETYTAAPSNPLFQPRPGLQFSRPVAASLKGGRVEHRILVGHVGEWLLTYRFASPDAGDRGQVLDTIWNMAATLKLAAAASEQSGSLPPVAPRPPADKRAAPRAEADAIIARAHAEAVFENATSGELPELRHKLSGFVCGFEPGAPDNRVTVYPRQPLGSDVACETRSAGAINSRFVTKFPIPVTVEQALQVYLTEIKQAHPDVKPAPGPFADVTVGKPGAPPAVLHRTARLTYIMNGEAAFSRVSVAVVKGWVIEQRITAPMKDATTADLMGELFMAADVDKMSGRDSPPPLPKTTAREVAPAPVVEAGRS